MHELFKQVLNERNLSRAGDLFSIPDYEILGDLSEVIKKITEISSQPDYSQNDNDQSVVEISVTRVTSCIRETGSVESHCGALVQLLEACLHHNLRPSSQHRDDDPPHAKIASDVISCIFLASDSQNYSKRSVMEAVLPVAVKFLHKGNRELSRNMARYISLAAIHHARLLKPHVQPIMDSIISGNYPLCRVLSQLYEVCPEPLGGHTMALVSLLPHAEQAEKLSLLSVFELMALREPDVLEASVSQLIAYLCAPTAPSNAPTCLCVGVLKVLLCLSTSRSALLSEHVSSLRRASSPPHASPQAVLLTAQIMARMGLTDKERAQEALNFVLECMSGCERSSHAALLREATSLCSAYPALFTDKVLTAVRARNSEVKQTAGGVTIVKLVGAVAPYSRRPKLGDSRSTGRLHTNTHRSMTRLNVAGGSVGGLHKSMTRLSSSQQINLQNNPPQNNIGPPIKQSNVSNKSSAVTVTNITQNRNRNGRANHHNIFIGANPTSPLLPSSNTQSQSISINPLGRSSDFITNSPITSSVSIHHASPINHVSVIPTNHSAQNQPISITGPVTVTSRRTNNTSVTMINSNNNANHRISVFEPYPMRDTVQHFCEKHLDKIKAYMENVSMRLPPPAKCTIEERRSKKVARVFFGCGVRGPHCLYARSLFSVGTRCARVWVHLMFLALQAAADAALSSRDANVASLKHCWDILKCDTKTFLTLVTSAFPGIKEQEMLLSELRAAGFFDVFELNTTGAGEAANNTNNGKKVQWGCFLCNHPERALGLLAGDGQPVMEGPLKEKKGRWRLFRRWRTRHFTLSGAHLTCKGSSGGESIDINQIRSVKVSRGARNIPKAFEIFTGDQTLILKPKDGKNAEEWVQCLNIAVAHSQARDMTAKSNSLPARGLTMKNL